MACIPISLSWFYEAEFKLFALKRTYGLQYLKPRLKYFNSLPRCEVNGLSTKPLINRSNNGIADLIANLIRMEGGSGKSVPNIPLKLIPYDCLHDLKWWYVDGCTGEAVVEDLMARELVAKELEEPDLKIKTKLLSRGSLLEHVL
ncbi:hypothetical protein L1987_80632 [Smallanthus sonchifolius]|uniref:Uncharacterized protein n=1 Tax=Smallanthus sonchifolius TaxID=185202 RepID=A0ACB8YN57_9ASTR|nr:hypothetical protein L1987_80632 [Smallanthus sonchifolius]